jgi:hypothetical protein
LEIKKLFDFNHLTINLTMFMTQSYYGVEPTGDRTKRSGYVEHILLQPLGADAQQRYVHSAGKVQHRVAS